MPIIDLYITLTVQIVMRYNNFKIIFFNYEY